MHTGAVPSASQATDTRVLYRGGTDLIERLDEIAGRSDLFIPYCAAIIVLFMCVPILSNLGSDWSPQELVLAMLLMLLALGGVIPVKRFSEQRRVLQVLYDLSRTDIVQRLSCAGTVGATLAGVERLWRMSTRTPQAEGAQEVVLPRLAVHCVKASPRQLALNIECWCLVAGPSRIFFLPDCLLVEEERRLTAITYDELTLEAAMVRYVEWDAVARDTQVAEEQWRFVKEGGDRVDDVRHVSICEYGELALTHPKGWQLVLLASDAKAVQQVLRALQELVRASQVENGTVPTEPVETATGASAGVPADGKPKAVEASSPAVTKACVSCKQVNPEAARFCQSCGNLMAELKSGLVLHTRYVVLGALGPGAVGMLYRVWDTVEEKAWALKEMPIEGRSDREKQDAMVRFVAEGQMLAGLQHQALPAIREHFSENGAHYLVLELVDGESMTDVLARDGVPGLSEELVLRFGEQLLDVLVYLHGQTPPVIFCGLQPALIVAPRRTSDEVLTSPPQPPSVRLMDFGVARSVRPFTVGSDIEAVGYASPEAYRGESDARSDLFSLAACMHHLLTGKAPSEAFAFEPVRSLAPHVSSRTEAVLKRALQMEPSARYISAESMRAAFHGEGDEAPDEAHPVREIRVQAEMQRSVVTNGMCHSVCFTPDGTQLLTGCYDLRLWDVQTYEEVRRDESGRGATCCALISNDGQVLAFGGLDGGVHLQPMQTPGELRSLIGHVDQVSAIAFSPSGRLLASASLDGTIRLWDVKEGSLRHVLASPGHVPRSLAFSPDGLCLASAFTNVVIWDVGTGARVRHVAPETLGGVSIRSLAYAPDGKLIACACSDASVRLLDASTLHPVRRMEGHENQVLTLAWAPIGWLLASGSSDATVRLWDVEAGDVVGCLEGHGSAVSSVAWSSDGRRLASGAWDLTARLWAVSYERLYKAPTTRVMTPETPSGI